MRGGETLRQVVWASAKPPGVEYCTVRAGTNGWALGGTIVRQLDGRSALITYLIETDLSWKTKSVLVKQLLDRKHYSLKIEVKRSRWFVRGREKKRLKGAFDVDLEASPVTNTLPIRRTNMRVGSKVDLTVAWVRFPSLRVEPFQQGYERMSKSRYVYKSSTGFRAEIEVDGFGLVRHYGDYWRAVSPGG